MTNNHIEQFQNDIDDLQTRLSYQEDTLQQLDQTIADQDKIIRSLVVQLARWEARLNEVSDSVAHPDQSAPELPPHY
ncbi:MAG: SlyX protein [Candidatus Endobugula sp.]|jgi:SlyX protein